MDSNPRLYKKSALITMYMARDLFLTVPGERIPTISEYTRNFDVSRGIVQNALEELTADGCIATEKRGVLGTFLVHADRTLLFSRTGWGSCSGKGNLNFNCLLMLAPPAVQDYVVVHELCHRKEMNHSPAFWAEVAGVLPDYASHRRWLRENGNGLIAALPSQKNGK